jgi:hypothetical protein
MDLSGHDQNVRYLTDRFPHSKVLRWTNHYDTILRAVAQSTTRYTWIISSCCNYQQFDFDFEPAPWQNHYLHVWPSGQQRFGDTFLVPTDRWLSVDRQPRLENHINPHFHQKSVPRLPWQVVYYDEDTVPDAVARYEVSTPYALYSKNPLIESVDYDPWLWREQPIVSFNGDNSTSIIPRAAHASIRQQCYDYKWLDKRSRQSQRLLDIVYISNGESTAESNWQHIKQITANRPNRLIRIDGVNGRKQAYQAAALASNTDWFLAVFAKLKVDQYFDWSWQPDCWQHSKHYIFNAYNPITDQTYGHMAMIAYNRRLVLSHNGNGLDFTLDQPHCVVPILSGAATYASDAWMAWRTAFRECIKLRHDSQDQSRQRLDRWLTADRGDAISDWSRQGARDAVEFYASVNGDMNQLRLSYEWDWLNEFLFRRHNLTPDQLRTLPRGRSARDKKAN